MPDTTLVLPQELITQLQRVQKANVFSLWSPQGERVVQESGMQCCQNPWLARYRNFRFQPFSRENGRSSIEPVKTSKIAITQLLALWVKTLLSLYPPDKPIVIAIDTSGILGSAAETSEDRGFIHLPNMPLVDKPIGIGWTRAPCLCV